MESLREITDRSARNYAAFPAFRGRTEDGYQTFTFIDAAQAIAKIQSYLNSLGIVHGDRVVIMAENRPEWPLAYLAVTTYGAIAVPIDAVLKEEDVLPLLADCRPKATIVSQKISASHQGLFAGLHLLIMERIATLPDPVSFDRPPLKASDVASIVYTSGTTGSPKGIVLTHWNLASNAQAVASLFKIGPGDNMLSVLPLSHTFETTAGFLAPFCRGSCITYTDSLKSNVLVKIMRETGVTIMCGVPMLYQIFFEGIMRQAEESGKKLLFDLLLRLSALFVDVIGVNISRSIFGMVHKKFGGKIRFFASGGAAISPELVYKFSLLGFTVLQGYGLTETSPIATVNDLSHNRIGSVGRPLPGVKVMIANKDGPGEILISGPNVMRGYYGRPDLTAEVMKDKWLKTGDVGYFDQDGYLFITGRIKEIIITGSGVNVYPDELEERLNKLPGVAESCVIGEKIREGIRQGTEKVIGVVVPKEGVSDAEINQQVHELNRQLAEFKRVNLVIRRRELPKTRLLKIKRLAVKKELADGK
ncbi:MAG: AMP-binding protein [Candidatus Margulisbacteria bacterium]|nr:AMP-binding protein [Candidatus Margulisiibacteriota bacterium]